MKKSLLTKVALPLALGVSLSGCSSDPRDFRKAGNYNTPNATYTANAWHTNGTNELLIYVGEGLGHVLATDRKKTSVDDFDQAGDDGRFDDLIFQAVPKGHEFESLVELGKLEEAYDAIKNGATEVYGLKGKIDEFGSRNLILKEKGKNGTFVAIDRDSTNSFDAFHLYDVPRESPLDDFIDHGSLEKVYSEIYSTSMETTQ